MTYPAIPKIRVTWEACRRLWQLRSIERLSEAKLTNAEQCLFLRARRTMKSALAIASCPQSPHLPFVSIVSLFYFHVQIPVQYAITSIKTYMSLSHRCPKLKNKPKKSCSTTGEYRQIVQSKYPPNLLTSITLHHSLNNHPRHVLAPTNTKLLIMPLPMNMQIDTCLC